MLSAEMPSPLQPAGCDSAAGRDRDPRPPIATEPHGTGSSAGTDDMRRHRHLDRSFRARQARRRLSFECLESRLVLTGIPTVGVYDENVIDPNTVDFVATGSSLTNTDFATSVASAFNQDMGGVIDGESLGQLYSYG